MHVGADKGGGGGGAVLRTRARAGGAQATFTGRVLRCSGQETHGIGIMF